MSHSGLWRRALASMLLAALGCGRVSNSSPIATREISSCPPAAAGTLTSLPNPKLQGSMSLEQALSQRRSVRNFENSLLSLDQIGQLAWAGQGITSSTPSLRTAPSAGALFPIELFVATQDGLLHYIPAHHALEQRSPQDLRPLLSEASLGQPSVRQAPCVFILVSVIERTKRKYGDRSARYVALEAGHVAQNILLQATALGLAGLPIGAFDDPLVSKALGLDQTQNPLYMVAVGRAAR